MKDAFMLCNNLPTGMESLRKVQIGAGSTEIIEDTNANLDIKGD